MSNMLQRRETNGLVYYASPLFEQINVPHCFSTRIGGISPAPFDSLNLGNPSGTDTVDDYDRIYENYRKLQRAIGRPQHDRIWVHQVHGGDVMRAPCPSGAKADALVCNDPAKLIAIRVADCVPVLLASDDGKVVGAIHSGWRGVIAGVVRNAIEAMRVTPDRILAAIGPCIGFDAFEVGGEVLHAFSQAFGNAAPMRRREDGKGYIDLRRAVQLQLSAAGIAGDHIEITDRCTYRDADEFFSHRRDRGVTGRMAALIATIA
jgi:YfiH family protein